MNRNGSGSAPQETQGEEWGNERNGSASIADCAAMFAGDHAMRTLTVNNNGTFPEIMLIHERFPEIHDNCEFFPKECKKIAKGA
ncbi:MAG: hypothetical protein LBR94_08090 [Desulfovibrio sp.]|nr:hypothetical protein [Desulfovibrio sp.]